MSKYETDLDPQRREDLSEQRGDGETPGRKDTRFWIGASICRRVGLRLRMPNTGRNAVSVQGVCPPELLRVARFLSGSKEGAGLSQLAASQAWVR